MSIKPKEITSAVYRTIHDAQPLCDATVITAANKEAARKIRDDLINNPATKWLKDYGYKKWCIDWCSRGKKNSEVALINRAIIEAAKTVAELDQVYGFGESKLITAAKTAGKVAAAVAVLGITAMYYN